MLLELQSIKNEFLHFTVNKLWQDMVTLNEDESLWSVQILVKALTTGQNADGHYY